MCVCVCVCVCVCKKNCVMINICTFSFYPIDLFLLLLTFFVFIYLFYFILFFIYFFIFLPRLVAPVPCKWCSGVAFCSPRCRDHALASYHRWECRFLDLLLGSGVSLNVYLALRVATQNSLHFFQKVKGDEGV